MKTYRIPIKKLSPCGSLIKVEAVVNLILPSVTKFDFWHNGKVIGSLFCKVGNMAIGEATDFLLDEYFKSDEFKAFKKEAGQWN